MKHSNNPRVLFRGGKDTGIIIIFTKNQGLLYQGLKLASRLAIRLLCRDIRINNPAILETKGPVLLAANHPNSFLDSILLDTLFKEPVWALARGDAFKKKWHARLLQSLRIFPVYRTSEGVENLHVNYQTFNTCVALFKQNQIVTIYSEALCVNEWHLRNLKKGTARLAIQAWEAGVPLTVLPVGLNYSSFRTFGKNIHINFGEPITADRIPLAKSDGHRHQYFNQCLQEELSKLVYEIAPQDKEKLAQLLRVPVSTVEKRILFPFALLGKILHVPLYYPLQQFTLSHFGKTGHYDSVLSALLLLSYPLYLMFIGVLLVSQGISIVSALLVIAGFPLFAWCHVRTKNQFDV
ncbi:MAG: 1-acyl-sn-glycerol-3-phosphate acyltransferase [Bacteroidota bacterium]